MRHYDGRSIFTVKGAGADAFMNESGGHRWQRIPPTERKGRVHTSTVTVAVMPRDRKETFRLNPHDVEEAFMRGSGKGGQKRNKTSSACRLTHIPTGTQVRIETERSQSQNRDAAWRELERRLRELWDSKQYTEIESDRKAQVGTGMRGDKRRTYRMQDDQVTDHISGKRASLSRVMRGELELLW